MWIDWFGDKCVDDIGCISSYWVGGVEFGNGQLYGMVGFVRCCLYIEIVVCKLVVYGVGYDFCDMIQLFFIQIGGFDDFWCDCGLCEINIGYIGQCIFICIFLDWYQFVFCIDQLVIM